jgi:hypothetical protein
MTDKQLRAHLQREANACKDLIRDLNNLELGSTGFSAGGDLESQNDNRDWEDVDGEEGNSILDARSLLQDMASTSKRTNAKNREKVAANWAKVRPKMLSLVTGRPLSECTCNQRKEKSIKVVSLTGMQTFPLQFSRWVRIMYLNLQNKFRNPTIQISVL